MKTYRKFSELLQAKRKIYQNIKENKDYLNSTLGDGIGLIHASYVVLEGNFKIGVAYIEGMIDKKLISYQVLEPLMQRSFDRSFITDDIDISTILKTRYILATHVTISSEFKNIINGLMHGNTVIFIEGSKTALIIDNRKLEQRAIEKPENEVTVFAANDSFTEDIDTNSSLLIRRLPTSSLQMKTFTVGTLSQTTVKLIWLNGIANQEAINEACQRIKQIDIDAVESAGKLAELIKDNAVSLFPTYKQSQRPDLTAKLLSDGRFAILCSNSPFAVIAPISFWDNFKNMDDYSETPVVASYLRILRTFAFLLAILVSPLYLSFVAFNHSIVPPPLAFNIATGREGVPFPSVIELILMTVSIDLIREAALRAAGSVGFFIGVLSAVVIGQASVEAGYVSASVIIVVAIQAISSLAISTTILVFPARLMNYFLIILAGTLGTFGLINGVIILLWHLMTLKSFGLPYLYPVVPINLAGLKDTLIRAPYGFLKKRLPLLAPTNRKRMKQKER